MTNNTTLPSKSSQCASKVSLTGSIIWNVHLKNNFIFILCDFFRQSWRIKTRVLKETRLSIETWDCLASSLKESKNQNFEIFEMFQAAEYSASTSKTLVCGSKHLIRASSRNLGEYFSPMVNSLVNYLPMVNFFYQW